MMRIIFLSVFMGIYGAAAFAQRPAVLAYYTGDGETIRQYPVAGLTHVIYSFLHLNGDTLSFRNEKQKATLRQLVSLKEEHPGLKILVALGGWGGCGPCSGAFSTPSGRTKFTRAALRLFREYNVDGIDIDWEYPTIPGYPGHAYAPEDRVHFTQLLREMRRRFGKQYEISFAAGGFTRFVEEAVDWAKVVRYVDRINLMTYDLVSGASTQTGHHTPLFSNPSQQESADHCITMLKARNIPLEKLVIGAAFYARSWKEVSPERDGLYQSGEFQSFIPYRKFPALLADSSGFVQYRDETSKSAWSYNARQKVFATYDDPGSVKAKAAYVLQNKLGGIMFWELTLDKPVDGLLSIILRELGQ